MRQQRWWSSTREDEKRSAKELTEFGKAKLCSNLLIVTTGGEEALQVKEKQRKGEKKERKGAVKVAVPGKQRIPPPELRVQAAPRRSERSAHSAPGAHRLRSLFEKSRRDGTLPCTGTLRLCQGGGKATWTVSKTKRRKERKQEGGWRDSWQCFQRNAIKK